MLHRLCGPPPIPLSFSLATVLPRRYTYHVSFGSQPLMSQPPSVQCLQRGLPGYLIRFDTHAFAHQRQLQTRELPSRSVFFPISIDFTPTLGILLSPPALQNVSSKRSTMVKPLHLTPCLTFRLRALYAQ